MRLALISAVSGWVNGLLKQVFHLPRPFMTSSDVRALDPFRPQGFSFPSGHAQLSLTLLGIIGCRMRSHRLWAVIILTLLSIGISRIWLGVHLPIDILGGWVIGAVILVSFILAEQWLSPRLGSLSPSLLITVALLLSAGMGLLSTLPDSREDQDEPLRFFLFWTPPAILTIPGDPDFTLITAGLAGESRLDGYLPGAASSWIPLVQFFGVSSGSLQEEGCFSSSG